MVLTYFYVRRVTKLATVPDNSKRILYFASVQLLVSSVEKNVSINPERLFIDLIQDTLQQKRGGNIGSIFTCRLEKLVS